MKKWQVKAIQVGTISGSMSGILHFGGNGKAVELPMWIVAATDGEHKVVIDTGIDELEPIVNGPEPFAHQITAAATSILKTQRFMYSARNG